MSETEVTTEVQFENSDDLDAFSDGFFGRKPAESTPTKVEAEQEQEPQEEVKTEAQDENVQTDEEDEAELQEEVKPKKKTVQDRIDEVVRQREELRRESAAQIEQLRKEIEALKKGPAEAPNTAKASEEPKHDAVDKDGNPIYPLGEFDPQYIRDLTRHTLSQERERMQAEIAEAQRQAAVQQEQQALQSTWNAKVEEATKQYPDLPEKGRAMLANFENLDPAYAGYLSQVIMQMDKGPDVLYYLSNHPEEAISIVNSGAQKATIALGRIEARFLQSEQEAPKPKISKAPAPPPARVQARGTNGAFISVAPDTDDLEAFEREFFKPQKY